MPSFLDNSRDSIDPLQAKLDAASANLAQCGDGRRTLTAFYNSLVKGAGLVPLKWKRYDRALASEYQALAERKAEIRANTPTSGIGDGYQDRENFIASAQAAYTRKVEDRVRQAVNGNMADDAADVGAAMATQALATQKWITATIRLSANSIADVIEGSDSVQRLQSIELAKRTCSAKSPAQIAEAHAAFLDLGDDASAIALELAAEPILAEIKRASGMTDQAERRRIRQPQEGQSWLLRETSGATIEDGTPNDPTVARYKAAQRVLDQFAEARKARRPAWLAVAVSTADLLQEIYEDLVGNMATGTRRPDLPDFPSAFDHKIPTPMKNMSSGRQPAKPLVYRDENGMPKNPHA